jgi:ribosomal protein L19
MSSKLKINLLNEIVKEHLRSDLPILRIGEEVIVTTKTSNEEKPKLVSFKGIIIRRKNPNLISYNFTVLGAEGVERIFFYHSASIVKIENKPKIRVRRANLSYLRRKEY